MRSTLRCSRRNFAFVREECRRYRWGPQLPPRHLGGSRGRAPGGAVPVVHPCAPLTQRIGRALAETAAPPTGREQRITRNSPARRRKAQGHGRPACTQRNERARPGTSPCPSRQLGLQGRSIRRRHAMRCSRARGPPAPRTPAPNDVLVLAGRDHPHPRTEKPQPRQPAGNPGALRGSDGKVPEPTARQGSSLCQNFVRSPIRNWPETALDQRA